MREYGFSVTHILPYEDKIYVFVFIRENTGHWKPVFLQILCSVGKTPNDSRDPFLDLDVMIDNNKSGVILFITQDTFPFPIAKMPCKLVTCIRQDSSLMLAQKDLKYQEFVLGIRNATIGNSLFKRRMGQKKTNSLISLTGFFMNTLLTCYVLQKILKGYFLRSLLIKNK